MVKLIYIADPMCSWCYGFGPELNTLLNGLQDVPVDIVLGGLRPYASEPLDTAKKAEILSHWHKVADASGLPFADTALQDDNFIYNTEPACRAVVSARQLAPHAALDVFHAIQHGFYAEGLDTTRADVLAGLAVAALNKKGVDIDETTFLQTWSSEETIAATNVDFLQTQRWGIHGFPTLVLERAGELHLVSSGFLRTEQLVEQLQAIVDGTAS
ncbi:MAG TPA: DsbA family protein [Oxalicibacterium sp.]|nr:DsbA family protein [Oxalicibacterium sp.]